MSYRAHVILMSVLIMVGAAFYSVGAVGLALGYHPFGLRFGGPFWPPAALIGLVPGAFFFYVAYGVFVGEIFDRVPLGRDAVVRAARWLQSDVSIRRIFRPSP